jgi:hypothetical protein
VASYGDVIDPTPEQGFQAKTPSKNRASPLAEVADLLAALGKSPVAFSAGPD